MKIQFTVTGKPIPKARPRVMSNGHVYTPKKTKDWEELVGWKAFQALGGARALPYPMAVFLDFAGTRANGDLDNYAKAVLDAMNGIVYVDDKQVDRLYIKRIHDGEPRVEITVMDFPTYLALPELQ